MNHEIKVYPGSLTRSAAGLSIVILALFLVFGAGLLLFAWQNSESEPGVRFGLLGFGAIWVVACGGLIRFNFRLWTGPICSTEKPVEEKPLDRT